MVTSAAGPCLKVNMKLALMLYLSLARSVSSFLEPQSILRSILRPASSQKISTSAVAISSSSRSSKRLVATLSATTAESSSSSSSSPSPSSSFTAQDFEFLQLAVECAKKGAGHTFPNPAVGCVLVRQDTGAVVGQGFHPRAGYPHAEVFALLEAAGHVESGVAAAESVVNAYSSSGSSSSSSVVGATTAAAAEDSARHQQSNISSIQELSDTYNADGGPHDLLADCLVAHGGVTAYVTLEPCCHTGQTPPCAAALALAKVNRVVVGFRDPNPRVDGGGVALLEDAGVTTELAFGKARRNCAGLVGDFVKRISPRASDDTYDSSMIPGKIRRELRALAGRMQQQGTLQSVAWGGASVSVDDGNDMEALVAELELKPEWMEHVDARLWNQELLLLRLGSAVAKKKGVKLLGERVANLLQAHVAQTKGHTVLLYRPGVPPVLDLNNLKGQAVTVVEDEKE